MAGEQPQEEVPLSVEEEDLPPHDAFEFALYGGDDASAIALIQKWGVVRLSVESPALYMAVRMSKQPDIFEALLAAGADMLVEDA